MLLFKELIDFRKNLSVHHLIYSHFSLRWRVTLIYLIWLYAGACGLLLLYFRPVPFFSWYVGVGLIPILLWGIALRKKVLQVIFDKLRLSKEEWKKTGLNSIRRKELDSFLVEHNQNYSAVILDLVAMVHRDSIVPDYRLKSPAIFASLFVGLGIATVSWLITQGSSAEVMVLLQYLTGFLLAIASTVGVIEWVASQALREHKTYLRKALARALNDCYFLYNTQEREREASKRSRLFCFKKHW